MVAHRALSTLIIYMIWLSLVVNDVELTKEVIKKLHTIFGKYMKECVNEEGLHESVMVDFNNFWKENDATLSRDFGCAIVCVSKKFNILNEKDLLHHENTHEFAVAFGGDEDVARQVVIMIHDCEKKHEEIEDTCSRIVEMAKCFKSKTHSLDWAPVIEEMVAEFAMDI